LKKKLRNEAIEILTKIYEGGNLAKCMGGYTIDFSFCPISCANSKQKEICRSSIQQLLEYNFLRESNPDIFRITEKGMNAVENSDFEIEVLEQCNLSANICVNGDNNCVTTGDKNKINTSPDIFSLIKKLVGKIWSWYKCKN